MATTQQQTMRAMAEVTKTVQLQRRHLFFWLLIVLFTAGLVFLITHANLLFAAAPGIPEIIETTNNGPSLTVDITINRDGTAVVNGKSTTKIFRPQASFDELKYKLLDKPKSFIDSLTVNVHFANPIPPNTRLQSFAVHGIDSASEKQLNDQTLAYTATGIGPEATYTIAAELPPGSIVWPWWRRAASSVANLPVGLWIGLAVAMPTIALIVLIFMFWPVIQPDFFADKPTQLPKPPKDLPPAVVGILVNGRVSAREIAATLLDLANRGYLSIFAKGNRKFALAKRAPWQNLKSFELLLLTELFQTKSYRSTNQDIELSVGRTLFSPGIARVYLAMYDTAASAGYFKENPGKLHQTYRRLGLLLFFIGLGAFTTAILTNLQPTFLLFFLAGLMSLALVIIVAADSVPLLTPAGTAARADWLAFRSYLAANELVGYVEGAQAYYERWLAYAVVLKTETAWVNRFRQHPFNRPVWYDSTQREPMSLEQFASGLYAIIGSIGELFSSIKAPTVE